MAVTINGSGPIAGATTVNGLTLPTDSLQPGSVLLNKTDFSSVASVSINNVFSSAYANYRLYISWSASVEATANTRLRASGTDATGNDYKAQYLEMNNTSISSGQVNTTNWWCSSAVTYNSTDMALFGPNIAATTKFTYNHVESVATGRTQFVGGAHTVASSYDGITFYASSGTISGTIRIYGMRNA